MMLRLVEEGKIRWPGVRNFDVALLSRCEALGAVASLQPPFSPIRRKVAGSELPWCLAHDVGVIAYSPMQSGLLTDGFSAARLAALPADDDPHRGRSSSRRASHEIWRSAMDCDRSRRGAAFRSGKSPLPGCSPGRR